MTPVQSTSTSTSAASNVSLTLTGVGAGNTVVFVVSYIDVSSSGTPTVPTGFAAAENPAAVAVVGINTGASIFYKANTSGTVTATMNSLSGGASLYSEASLTEWQFTATPLDQNAGPGTSQGASTTTASTPTTGTLAQAAETVIVAISIGASTGLANAGISNPPSGYTSLAVAQDTATGVGAQISYKDAPSTAGQNATWTYTSDSSQVASEQVIATFKQASATPSTVLPRFVGVLP